MVSTPVFTWRLTFSAFCLEPGAGLTKPFGITIAIVENQYLGYVGLWTSTARQVQGQESIQTLSQTY